jgi:hypothetical protein
VSLITSSLQRSDAVNVPGRVSCVEWPRDLRVLQWDLRYFLTSACLLRLSQLALEANVVMSHRPYEGGGKHVGDFGKFLPDYKAQHPTKSFLFKYRHFTSVPCCRFFKILSAFLVSYVRGLVVRGRFSSDSTNETLCVVPLLQSAGCLGTCTQADRLCNQPHAARLV